MLTCTFKPRQGDYTVIEVIKIYTAQNRYFGCYRKVNDVR